MSTTAAGPISDDSSAQARRARRDRDEIEALASKFIAGQANAEPATSRMPVVGALAAGVAAFAVLIWVLWPEEAPTPQSRAAATAASEVAGWQQGFEARRERKRKELESGADYLSRAAAADAALMNEMSERAEALAKRAAVVRPAPAKPAPAQVAAKGEPTPRTDGAAPAPAVVASAAPTQIHPEAAAVPKAEPPAAQAQAAPAAAAQVASANCSIHVADLSASGTLTYDAVARMKGARVDGSTGHVFTPPVKARGGRTVVFEVMPDGCVSIVR